MRARFISDGRARTYTLTLLNCYGDLAIGYGCGGATTLHSNDRTKERLQAQRSIFTDKRQQMGMPDRPQKASIFDIKIIRAYKPASMVVKVEK
uniref:Uncharacterized protein n=1 Tax=Ditylenchus dipsaci TaxID=166011 RepID=A0A915E797_9BILA